MAIVAAGIFAMGIVMTARMRRGYGGQTRREAARRSFSDLGSDSGSISASKDEQQGDLARNLEQLRSLVRSALSALTPSENSFTDPLRINHQSLERILSFQLEKSNLPRNAPHAAHDLLISLMRQIDALGPLLKESSASDISEVLVKVNNIARNLLAVVATTSSKEKQPTSRRQP